MSSRFFPDTLDVVGPCRPAGVECEPEPDRPRARVSLEPSLDGPPPPRLVQGDLLGGRFVIEQLVGTGGMGVVHRALDRLVGGPVAIKVIGPGSHAQEDRFREEVRVLAQLEHPAIVRYVTHGATPEGGTFLAMEWLDGEDLAQALARRRLTVEESMTVARRAAEGLAVAHAAGIVHRDIKPSNLFLQGGDASRTRVLDFGIARRSTQPRVITRTGAILGTVGYMAPEQARGLTELDARADVFALGCVLFECLTGRPAFASEHSFAVIAKILLEEAPRLRALRPELPLALEDLVSRMLAKDPGSRPADALRLVAELHACTPSDSRRASATTDGTAPRSITRMEQQFMSVMLLELASDGVQSEGAHTANVEAQAVASLQGVARGLGYDLVPLAGSVVIALQSGQVGGTDGASHAASCALRLRRVVGVRRIALATGRAEAWGGVPAGPVIDRATALLRAMPHGGPIAIDAVTAGLLDARFEVAQEDSAHLLLDEHLDSEWPRTVLGRRPPCVGRERELAILDAVAAECFSAPGAHAVLVTGAPGIGKSRLRREFVARIRRDANVKVLVARGDPVAAGSSLALARQILRSAIDNMGERSQSLDYAAVKRYLARSFDGPDLARVTDFLAQLLGLSSAEEPSPQLRAARDHARIMNEWMRRSFGDWLAAECAAARVLLVLEDLHWGDLPSLHCIEDALGRLPESPFMVLAFARPEVHDVFPKLRANLVQQEITLGQLTRRAAERLTRTLLGDSVADGLVAGIVDQAYGNAFVIEELVRRAVESGSAEVPETVLAIVSARLHALESEARLVLRAASVFGNVFWERGVAALLRGLGPEVDVQAWLEVLVAREVVTPERSTKFTGEGAYAFRHALLREGAYVMLTDADRRQGHLLAAGWLAGVGEKDALVVADHYEHALHAGQAVPWLLRAAEVALDGADIDVAIRIAARGLQGATGETRGMFLEIQQLACSFRGDWSGAFAAGAGAMSLLEPGTTRWFRSAGSAMLTGIYLGKPETTVDVLQRSAALPTPEPSGPFGLAMYMLVGTLLHAGAREMVLGLIDRLEAAARTQTDPDPAFAGWLGTTRCTAGLFLFDRVGPSLIAAQEAVRSFDGAADRVGWAAAALYCGIAHIEAGQPEAARHWLEEVVARSKDALLPTGDFARYYLARVEALRGNPAMAEALLQAPPGIADGARAFVAEALWRNGDVDGARREGQRVTSSASVYARVSGMSVLARIALHEGRAAEAISLLDRAIADQNAGSAAPFWRSILLLTRAEALDAAGDRQAARAAIAEANERLERIAAGFADPALRESYLTAIEENARTQALARAWRWRGPQR